jgi:hypothetical protein
MSEKKTDRSKLTWNFKFSVKVKNYSHYSLLCIIVFTVLFCYQLGKVEAIPITICIIPENSKL